jgi:hypothetical protein
VSAAGESCPPSLATVAEAEAACWETAALIRRDHPGWVVVWIARKAEYQAWPLFRAPRGTVATAATAQELITRMDRVQQASRRRRKQRSGGVSGR